MLSGGEERARAPEERRQDSLIRRMLFVMAANPKAGIM